MRGFSVSTAIVMTTTQANIANRVALRASDWCFSLSRAETRARTIATNAVRPGRANQGVEDADGAHQRFNFMKTVGAARKHLEE